MPTHAPERPLSPAALAFRAVHALIAVVFLAAIADVWWCAVTAVRNRWLRPAAGALLLEGVAVAANHGDCPLGPLQARAGDPVPLFELVLSPAAARRAVPALGALAGAGIALIVLEDHSRAVAQRSRRGRRVACRSTSTTSRRRNCRRRPGRSRACARR